MSKMLTSGRSLNGRPKKGHAAFALTRCYCGKEMRARFYPSSPQRLEGKHCSRECMQKSRETVVECAWCGIATVLKGSNRDNLKTCCHTHGVLLTGWGCRARFDSCTEKAREMLTTQGMSRKKTYQALGISATSLQRLCEYNWGSNAYKYFGDMRAKWNAQGLKGKSNKTPTMGTRIRQRGSDERLLLATILRTWRTGETAARSISAAGAPPAKGTVLLSLSARYRAASARRKKDAGYLAREQRLRRHSNIYKSEREFADSLAESLKGAFDRVERERMASLNGDLRRVDLFIVDGLFRYAVEVKAHNRTARMDQCLGQALVKAIPLGATPVCAFPDDVRIDKTFKEAAAHYGALVCNEADLIQCIKTLRLPSADSPREG